MSSMNSTEDCLIINLDSRKDLWNSLSEFRETWSELGKRVHRISGIDIRNDTHNFNKLIVSSRIELQAKGFRIKKESVLGEIGCYLSHYKAWKYVVDNNLKSCLILEDGVKMLKCDFENIEIDKNLDILFVNKEMKKNCNIFHGYGLQSYVVTIEGANNLMKSCYRLCNPIDLQVRNLCNSKVLIGDKSEFSFFKRDENRLSSIENRVSDIKDLNSKQDIEHNFFERIVINMIRDNVDIDKFI